MTDTPKAYIACLASYNAGILHGEWIDLDGTEEIGERIEEILKVSPVEDAEEWAIHDYEFCTLSEYSGLGELEELSRAFQQTEQDGIDWNLFRAFCDHAGHEIAEEKIAIFSEAHAGSGSSLVDWCQDFLEETGQLEAIPESLRFYFDYDAYARDMEINDVFTVRHEGDTHVFWQR